MTCGQASQDMIFKCPNRPFRRILTVNVGGTHSNVISYFSKDRFNSSEISLSSTKWLYPCPFFYSLLYILSHASVIVLAYLFGIGSAKIALESQSQTMQIYSLPLLDLNGNRPVKSPYTISLCEYGIIFEKSILLFYSFSGNWSISSALGSSCTFVDRKFFRSCDICPFDLGIACGTNLQKLILSIPGHINKNLF